MSQKEVNNIKSPLKAIRAKCLDCVCGSVNEVKLCPCTDCSLYPFRFGKNPFRKPMSEERKEVLRQRAKENFHHNTTDIEE